MRTPQAPWILVALATSLAMGVPQQARSASGSCDVVVQLDDPGLVSIVALGVDYSGTTGEFVGHSTQNGFGGIWDGPPLACRDTPEFFDGIDDKAGLLSLFFADTAGIVGPTALTTCVFEYFSGPGCPAPGDFSITDQDFPPAPPPMDVPPFPLPSAPGASIASVTPRTAVCGDGFREAPEECDDGNGSDGDCCSSLCTFEPADAPCSDSDVCTLGETCDGAGRCVAAATQSCDDGVFCTHDVCDPVAGCIAVAEPTRHAGGCGSFWRGAKFDLRDHPTADSRDRVFLRGRTGSSSLVGDPTADTDYALCIWDMQSGTPILSSQIDVPAGPGWRAFSSAGSFRYDDPAGTNGGIERIRIRRNRDGLTKFFVRGSGASLSWPGPADATRRFSQEPEVIVELENDTPGGCWSLELSGAETRRNDSDRFLGVAR